MNTQAILAVVEAKLENINQAIEALRGGNTAGVGKHTGHGNRGRAFVAGRSQANQHRDEKKLGGEEKEP